MPDITPEQAAQLLDQGHISQETHDLIVGDKSSVEPAASKDDLSDLPIQNEAQNKDEKPLDVSPVTNQDEVQDVPNQSAPPSQPQAAVQPSQEPSRAVASTQPGPSVRLGSDVVNAQQQPGVREQGLNQYSKETDDALAQIAKGTTEQAKIGMQQGARVAGQIAGVQNELNEQAKKSAAVDVIDQQAVDERRQKVDDSIANATKTAAIDPHRFWGTRSTEQKIAIGIGMFLGAFGAIRNGENGAVDVVHDAINRDIEAQKATAANAKGVVQEQQSMYGRLLDQTKDRHLAENMTRAALLDKTKLMIEATAAQSGGVQAATNARIALGHLALERAELNNKIQTQLQTQHILSGSGTDTQKAVFGAPALGLKPDEVLKQYDAAQKHVKLKEDINDIYNQSAKKATLLGKLTPGNSAQLAAEDSNFMSKMRVAYGTRWTDKVEEELLPLLPSALSRSKTQEVQRAQINNMVDSMAPDTGMLDALKINPIKKGFTESPRVRGK